MGVAAGESLPFVHDEDGDVVDVYVACHGEAARAPDLPAPRVLHAASWVATESVVRVTGGAAAATLGEAGPDDATAEATVFEMDPWSGEWTVATPMLAARRRHLAVDVPQGLVVLGGAGEGPDGLDAVELLAGDERTPLGALAARFAGPTGAAIGDRVLVAGRSPEASLAVYDVAAGTGHLVAGAPEALAGAAVIALDGAERALVVGGATDAGAPGAVRLYCDAECDACESAPCLVDVPADEPLPGPDWSSMSAAYVPCEAGGGSVVIAGGHVGPAADRSTTDAVYCWRDEPGEIGSVSLSTETLSAPRGDAPSGVLARVEGGFWVVVAGGSDFGPVLPDAPEGADLLELNGCSCDVTSVETIDLPSGSEGATRTVGAAMAALGDGSLLLAGGLATPPLRLPPSPPLPIEGTRSHSITICNY